MRVALTGATGFIGGATLRALQARTDVEVLALHRPGAAVGRLGGVEARALGTDLTPSTLAALLREERVEALLHLGWAVPPRGYLSHSDNIDCLSQSARLFEAAIAAGVERVVGVGTGFEYGSTPAVRHERTPLAPRSLYAGCKVAAGAVLEGLGAASGRSVAWARVFHVFGPGEHPERLMPLVIGALRVGRPIALTDGGQLRDYLHVDDVAAGLVRLLHRPETGAMNVCSGEARRLREVLLAFGEALGRPELLHFGARPRPPEDEPVVLGAADRLRATGWAPRHGLESAVADTLARSVGDQPWRPALPS